MTTTLKSFHASGPCGDTMTVHLRSDGERILEINGESDGCGASWQAIAKCCQMAEGQSLAAAAREIRPEAIIAACELPPDHQHCARLAVCTLRGALDAVLPAATACCSSGGPDESDCSSCSQQTNCAATAPDRISAVILVMAGKGGVGKSSVAAGVASALAGRTLRVGLLDADVHGPSAPRMMGVSHQGLCRHDDVLLPQLSRDGVHICSSGLLGEDPHQAFIQRGPAKSGLILSMIRNVAWGALDVLVVDLPPGTGDESLVVTQHFAGRAKALLVTTPQDVALDDAQRCLSFCETLELPVLGIIENMAGFRCPDCGNLHAIFPGTAADTLATRSGAPVLARLPLDPALALAGEKGWSHLMPLAAVAEHIALDLAQAPAPRCGCCG